MQNTCSFIQIYKSSSLIHFWNEDDRRAFNTHLNVIHGGDKILDIRNTVLMSNFIGVIRRDAFEE